MDRSLKVFLITMFGVGGLVIILHAWLIPTALTERIMMTTLAVLGWALAWVFHRFGTGITKNEKEDKPWERR